MKRRSGLSPSAVTLVAALAAAACDPEPQAHPNPTWADVEVILRGQCNHCHGGYADVAGSSGPATYRFDFYDVSAAICGDAALAMTDASGAPSAVTMARGLAAKIKESITPRAGDARPRMPPAPAEPLPDFQRETLRRWADNPVRGAPPVGNLRPRLDAWGFSGTADKELTFTAVAHDPDGEPVIGVLRVNDLVYKLDRPGSFTVRIDTSKWKAGSYKVTATVCDGWQSTSYEIGDVAVTH